MSRGGASGQFKLWSDYNRVVRNINRVGEDSMLNQMMNLSPKQLFIHLDLLPYLSGSTSRLHDKLTDENNEADYLMLMEELESCLSDIESAVNRSNSQIELEKNQVECLNVIITRLTNSLTSLLMRSSNLRSRKWNTNGLIDQQEPKVIGGSNLVHKTQTRADLDNQANYDSNQQAASVAATSNDNQTSNFKFEAGTTTTLNNNSTFIGRAYREALGSALSIVVGSGLLILMLNLIVVLFITIRARRARQNCNSVADSSECPQMINNGSVENQASSSYQLADSIGININGEPLRLKSTLKRPSNINQFDVETESNENFLTSSRKQLKFDLAEEDVNQIDNKQVELYEQTNGATYFNTIPIFSLQDSAQINCPNNESLSMKHYEQGSIALNNLNISYQQQQQHHEHQQAPIDQWSQTICSELSSSHEPSSCRQNSNSNRIHLDSCPLVRKKQNNNVELSSNLVDFYSPGTSTSHSVTPINALTAYYDPSIIPQIIHTSYEHQYHHG